MRDSKPDVGAKYREHVLVDEAVFEAAHEAWTLHKKLGLPLAAWRDGKVVHIPPEEIDVEAWASGDPAEDGGSSSLPGR